MAAGYVNFWVDFAMYEEGERWSLLASQHLTRLPRVTSARLLFALGELHTRLGRYSESERFLRDSVSTY